MPVIHPTAAVDSRAEIESDVEVGPYCVIGPHVVLAQGCRLTAHVHLAGHTAIGARTRIAPFASLGTPPQSVRYRGGPTRLVVGADCDIREHVTMNIGTEFDRGVTEVGDRCFFMVGAHVGHDCKVGNDVNLANHTMLGGHVTVGDYAVFGGAAAIHQFVSIGEGAMISGLSGVPFDVIPFGLVQGSYAVLKGLNLVGLRRRGYSREEIQRLRQAYRFLFHGEGIFNDRLAKTAEEFGEDQLAGKVVAFIRGARRRRLLGPRGQADAEPDSDVSP
jgi:UDP-N-acetylglucosamine acyltransferase